MKFTWREHVGHFVYKMNKFLALFSQWGEEVRPPFKNNILKSGSLSFLLLGEHSNLSKECPDSSLICQVKKIGRWVSFGQGVAHPHKTSGR